MHKFVASHVISQPAITKPAFLCALCVQAAADRLPKSTARISTSAGTVPLCLEDPDGLLVGEPLPGPVDELVAVGEAGEYSNAQDSSNDKTSPTALVTDIGGHEKFSGSVVVVFVVVVVVVVRLVVVNVIVFV